MNNKKHNKTITKNSVKFIKVKRLIILDKKDKKKTEKCKVELT